MKFEKIEIILGRILLSMISFLTAFVLIDYASTWIISNRAPIERRFPVDNTRHPRPYTMFGGKPNTVFGEQPDTIQLNSLGYRGKKPVSPKNTDEFRIFILGGSTVFRGNPPIAVLLEEEFNSNGCPNVKVYNFGVLSSVSSMELSRVVFEISELEPDLIVMYNGGNDILHPWTWDPRPGYPFNFVAYESNPLLDSDVRSYPSLALLAYGSNIFRYLFRSYFVHKFAPLENLREETQWNSEEWKAKIANTYVSNLIKADKISRSFDAEFIAFFQPLVYFKPNTSIEEKPWVDDGETATYAADMRRRILSKIDEAKAHSSAKIVDLSGMYEDTTDWVFIDSIHTRQERKLVIAQEMHRQIVNNLELEQDCVIRFGENIEQ